MSICNMPNDVLDHICAINKAYGGEVSMSVFDKLCMYIYIQKNQKVTSQLKHLSNLIFSLECKSFPYGMHRLAHPIKKFNKNEFCHQSFKKLPIQLGSFDNTLSS